MTEHETTDEPEHPADADGLTLGQLIELLAQVHPGADHD